MFRKTAGWKSTTPEALASSPFRKQMSSRIGAAVALVAAAIGMGFCDMCPAMSQQASGLQNQPATTRHIVLTRYKSRTIQMDRPFAQAVVGAPDVADVLPISDRVIYIQGKKIGTTNVSVFDQDKKLVSVLDLDVTLDIQNIRSKIRSGTDSPGILVSASNEQIVLSGEARNSMDAERAVSIAKSLVTMADGKEVDEPGKYVVNAMRVAASQQVMLRVRFIEVSRQAERDIGVNWFGSNASGTRGINTGRGGEGGGLLGPVTQAGRTIQGNLAGIPTPGAPPSSTVPGGLPLFQTLATFAGSTLAAPFGVGLFNLARGGTSIDVLITALEEKGLARKLAEPDLVALSGDKASFLAGGEYPVPSVQSSSGTAPVITTNYKKFGVQLNFTPTVLANGIINLSLEPEVSELDYANATVISGYVVPGLSVRNAKTVIELRDGQSFAIAGLLQSNNLRDVSQVPWLGSVPILGALFRSSSYNQKETDLVVIVTPHLVAPATPGQALATPFDKDLPSNDIDFFLMGRPEVRKQYTDYVTAGGQLNGPYGHMMPLEPK